MSKPNTYTNIQVYGCIYIITHTTIRMYRLYINNLINSTTLSTITTNYILKKKLGLTTTMTTTIVRYVTNAIGTQNDLVAA